MFIKILKYDGFCKKKRKHTIEESSSDETLQRQLPTRGKILNSINKLLDPIPQVLAFKRISI